MYRSRSVNNIVLINCSLLANQEGVKMEYSGPYNQLFIYSNYLFYKNGYLSILIINIVLSFSVFIYTIQRLLLYYQNHLSFIKPLIKYSIFLLCVLFYCAYRN